jgi:hypothetical protein
MSHQNGFYHPHFCQYSNHNHLSGLEEVLNFLYITLLFF